MTFPREPSPAIGLVHHLLQRRLAPVPDARRVDGHRELPLLLGLLEDGVQVGEHAGVVDHDVQPPERGRGERHDLPDLRQPARVAVAVLDPDAEVGDERVRRLLDVALVALGACLAPDVRAHDVRPLAREREGDRAPVARARARHHRGPAVEPRHVCRLLSDRVARQRLAAVDADEVAVDVARVVRGEEDRELCDVLDLAPALERDRVGEELVEVLVVEQRPRERRLRVGRADAVDADALVAVLDRQAAREVRRRALGGVVDALVRVPAEARRSRRG